MNHHTGAVLACQQSDAGVIRPAAGVSPPRGDRIRDHRLVTRYGTTLLADGYTALPNLAWRYYGRLGVSEAEFVFIGQLCTYWWGSHDPFPGEEAVARHMGKSKRCVQGYARSLEQKGLLRVSARFSGRGRQHTNSYDVRPFFEAIEALVQLDGSGDNPASIPSPDDGDEGADAPSSRRSDDTRIAPNDEGVGGTNDSSPQENPVETDIFALDSMPPTPMTTQNPTPRRVTAGERLGRGNDSHDVSRPLTGMTADDDPALATAIQDLGAELGDDAPASSLTRMRNLRSGAGVSPRHFLRLVDDAAARTRARQGRIVKRQRDADGAPNAMPYFFAVLADLLRPTPPDPGADRRPARRTEAERRRTRGRKEAVRSPEPWAGPAERLPITATNVAWRAVLDDLALVLTVENFNTWLAPTRVVAQEGDLLRIAVPRHFNKDWLETRLHARVMGTLQRLGYTSMCVEYIVDASA